MEKKYYVKAKEEELGTDMFVVTSDKSEEETMAILAMAARYSTVNTELSIEMGVEEYDEHYEAIVNNQECGLYKFVQYVELKGLKITGFECDFEFEW